MAAMQPILAIVQDLFFRAKLDAAAQAAGVRLVHASDLNAARERCEQLKPALIFVDLSTKSFSATEVVQLVREAAPGAKLIGFASHVDVKALGGARDAGFATVLSRSEFVAQLPRLLVGDT